MAGTEPELVKPAQSRRGRGCSYVTVSESGGTRMFVKHQREYWCRPIWRAFRRTPLLLRELRALKACSRLGINVPAVIDYQEQDGTSRLTLAEVADALALDEALNQPDADREAIIGAAASCIGLLHRAGWSHGALYPHHILISRQSPPAATLIDLEKARRNPLKRSRDLQRFWRHAPPLSSRERQCFEQQYQRSRRGP